MPDIPKGTCPVCDREGISLTVNKRLRSHTANGKRASATNPHCGGGSGWPKHDHDYQQEGDGVWRCQVCDLEDPRPSGEDVRNAEQVINAPEAPDDVTAQAEAILELAELVGIRPCATHRYSLGVDHCLDCGVPDDRPTAADVRDAMLNAMGAPPEAEDAALSVVSDAISRGVRSEPRSTDRPPGGTTMKTPSADDLLDGDEPEGDDSPSYFHARYDGSCGTCGADFAEGDMIRKAPDGGWEGEDCCGSAIDAEVGQRPRATAPQLPVRNGRYQGPHPETGKPTSFTRTTTFNGAVADNFALKLWEERMGAMGFVKRPDLLEKVANLLNAHGGIPYEVAKIQRERLNKIFEDAKLAAGSKDRARKGTILHKHTQEIDMGRKSAGDVPDEFRRSVNAYLTAMTDSGLECVPDLIERSTCVILGNRLALQVAGTFDRILRVTKELRGTLDSGREVVLKVGEYVIGDVKSGQDLSYAWDEIEIQEAIYAHGVNEFGVATPDQGHWRWTDLAEFGIDKVRLDVGVVMHMPYGESQCDLYFADLIEGWAGAKLCASVTDRRSRKIEMTPVREYVTGEKPVKAFEAAGAKVAAGTPPLAIDTKPPVSARQIIRSVPDPVGADATGKGDVVQATRPRRTWEDVARAVTTKEEANKVWAEMRKKVATIGTARLNSVVAIMRETLQAKGVV